MLWSTSPDAWAAKKQEKQGEQPMDFVLVHRSGDCASDCPTWISAEGQITAGTPARLKAMLARLGKDKPPILLHSGGGDVISAYKMGRMIRKQGLTTMVAGTRLEGCPNDEPRCRKGIARKGLSSGRTYSVRAYCFSACPLVFAGGTTRLMGSLSMLGVHQITTTYDRTKVRYEIRYRIVKGRKVEISRREVSRKTVTDHTTTKLDSKARDTLIAYLTEMNINPFLISIMMSATPQDIQLISAQDAMMLGLVTGMLTSSNSPDLPPCGPANTSETRCAVVRVQGEVAAAPAAH